MGCKHSKEKVCRNKDKTVRMFEISTGREIKKYQHLHPVASVALTADGKFIVARASDNRTLVFDVLSGSVAPTPTSPIAFTTTFAADYEICPDGRDVVIRRRHAKCIVLGVPARPVPFQRCIGTLHPASRANPLLAYLFQS